MAAAGDIEPQRKRWGLTILLTMYAGYMALMLCRNTLIAASPAMIEDPTLGFDKETYGQVMSWHSAGAIAGKIVYGLGADRLGGRLMFFLVLSVTALSNVAFGLVSSLTMFKVFHFTGQFGKSGGWPSMAKLICHWYRPNQHGRMWSIISTSSRVGTIFAMLLVGSMIEYTSWRAAFFLTAGIAGMIAIAALLLLRERPQDVGLPPLDEDATESRTHPLDSLGLAAACVKFVMSARFWLIGASVGCLTVLVDFLTFIPIFLRETLAVSQGGASMASTSFIAGMFVALIATGIAYDRFSKSQLVWVLGAMLLFACGCVLTMLSFPELDLSEAMRKNMAVVTLFAFGFSIAPAYYVPMSIFSVAFGGKHSGFLIAVIDIFGYALALLFNYFGGTIAQDYGWTVFLQVLLTVAVIATVTTVGFLFLDARAEKKIARP
ncbi:MAG: MFS transporter [Planctomycetota bacterium]